MNKNLQAHLALLFANLIYSASFTIAKEVMPDFVKPSALVFLRVIGACSLFWIYSLFIKERVDKKHILHFFLLSICGVFLNQMMFLKGLSITTPINAAIIMVTSPIVVVLLALLTAREKFNTNTLFGVVLGFIGAAALLTLKSDLSFGTETMLGDLLILLNAVSWSIYIIYVKKYMLLYNTVTVLKWVFLFGLILVTPFSIGEVGDISFHLFTPRIWMFVLFIVVVTTFFAYLLNTYALKTLSSSVVSAYIYLQPLLATAIALFAGKDSISGIKIISALLIFLGVYLTSKK
ncbi:MAG: DMT family transporter [Bacteroidetes bacterium]|nr:DMT family transporter [Bacteroidota bacterium]